LKFGIFKKHSPDPCQQKPKAGSENPSATLRTSLSQPEPIAMFRSFQNGPPDDKNCPLTSVVHFEMPNSDTL